MLNGKKKIRFFNQYLITNLSISDFFETSLGKFGSGHVGDFRFAHGFDPSRLDNSRMSATDTINNSIIFSFILVYHLQIPFIIIFEYIHPYTPIAHITFN